MATSKIDFGNQRGFETGAGKGDIERPINRRVFRENLSKVKWKGTPAEITKVGNKTTYTYK